MLLFPARILEGRARSLPRICFNCQKKKHLSRTDRTDCLSDMFTLLPILSILVYMCKYNACGYVSCNFFKHVSNLEIDLLQ